ARPARSLSPGPLPPGPPRPPPRRPAPPSPSPPPPPPAPPPPPTPRHPPRHARRLAAPHSHPARLGAEHPGHAEHHVGLHPVRVEQHALGQAGRRPAAVRGRPGFRFEEGEGARPPP